MQCRMKRYGGKEEDGGGTSYTSRPGCEAGPVEDMYVCFSKSYLIKSPIYLFNLQNTISVL